MIIKYILDHPGAIPPAYARAGDAGLDLVAVDVAVNFKQEFIEYDTGICVEIPAGFVGFLYPRSSISKYDLQLANSVGVIDSGYRGRIKARFRLTKDLDIARVYNKGDRVTQLIIMPVPQIQLIQAVELSDSQRGVGGFGSTDN